MVSFAFSIFSGLRPMRCTVTSSPACPVRAAWNRAMVTHTLSLEDLMLWAFRGFFTEEELRSL